MTTIFFASFPAEQTSHFADLMFRLIEKNTNKKYSKPSQVQPILLSFLKPVDPRLSLTEVFACINKT